MRFACFQTLWQVHEGISREPFGLRPSTQDVLSLTLSKDRSLGRFPVVLIHVTGSNGHVRSSLQNRTRGLCTWGPAPGITQACLDCSDPTGTLLLPLGIGVAQKSPCFSLPTIRVAAWTALPSGHVPIRAVCSALYKGERVDPQWAERSALERLAEIPPEELSRREAKELRLYRRSPLPSWDLVLH